MPIIKKSNKLEGVCYDIRGPVLKQARRMEDEGHKVLKLNIGNPAAFGFDMPEDMHKDIIRNLSSAQGYCDAKGLYSARVAIYQHYQQKNFYNLDVDIVINVQGDEPFIDKDSLAKLIQVYKNDDKGEVDLASLMREITAIQDIENPNNVKVVVDQSGFALYFSRSVIPYPREKNVGVRYMQHVGIYAFRKEALMDFYRLPMLSLEASEKLEQLRYLEYGKRIKMVETSHGSIGIDTIEDLEKARKLLS